jgi:hypothetical protein
MSGMFGICLRHLAFARVRDRISDSLRKYDASLFRGGNSLFLFALAAFHVADLLVSFH